MPVTFCPAPHNDIRPVDDIPNPLTVESSANVLRYLRLPNKELPDEILQSSLVSRDPFRLDALPPSAFESGQGVAMANAFVPRINGLVHTIIEAYNRHHALVLRPDDIWICVLTQFSNYVNGPGRSEELRSRFVAHEGMKHLIVYADGDRYTVDFGSMAKQMTGLIQENVVDPTLQKWILPDFSTTTPNDVVAASVVMMATLQSYFSYEFHLLCGIPRVTLLGDKSDWESILTRIEKLREYGPETKAWYRMLQPVIRRFVRAFDVGYADSDENVTFWQRVVHYSAGSGSAYLSGWITAFCAFNDKGEWIGGSLDTSDDEPVPNTIIPNDPEDVLILDGVIYHSLDTDDIPRAQSEVPVKLNDNGALFDTAMVAGLVGTSVGDSGVRRKDGYVGTQDQVSPTVGWWMFTLQEGRTREMEDREAAEAHMAIPTGKVLSSSDREFDGVLTHVFIHESTPYGVVSQLSLLILLFAIGCCSSFLLYRKRRNLK